VLKKIKNKKIAISKLALDIPLNHPVNDVYKGTFDESEVLGYLPVCENIKDYYRKIWF